MKNHGRSLLIALAILTCATGAWAKSKAKSNASSAAAGPLTLYGVEMNRGDQISLKEFRNYVRSHGRAEFVISKSPTIDYEGTGDVILADYTTDKATADKTAADIASGAKTLEIHIQPSLISKRGVGIYKLPLMKTEDSLMGDIWIQAGSNEPQKIESGVVISSKKPNIANLFKLVGFSDKSSWVVYCLDECLRYDLVTGTKTAQPDISGVEASGIRRSIDNMADKDKDCSKKLTNDFIQNADNNGYYRGVCPSKSSANVLEVRLQRDSGRWKVVNSSWTD